MWEIAALGIQLSGGKRCYMLIKWNSFGRGLFAGSLGIKAWPAMEI
jgi:hypothetical protein